MKQKRTKRYGGFLVGDRVQRKDRRFEQLQPGVVVAMRLGRLTVQWKDLNGKTFRFCYMPNQLINLTRYDEDVKASIKALKEHINFLNENGFPIDFTPTIESLEAQKRVITFSPTDLTQNVEEL